MERNSNVYKTYVDILEAELRTAMGCTEPIALAYCAAKAREVLKALPEEISVLASGNIIKNVKSVVVPNTGGLKGIEAAAAVGALYGDPSIGLDVLSKVTEGQAASLKDEMKKLSIRVGALESDNVLDMIVKLKANSHEASVRITDTHTNITEIKLDGKDLPIATDKSQSTESPETELDYSLLSVKDIVDFANTAELEDVKAILDRQIDCNMKIASAGIHENYGARIGQTLLATNDNTRNRAKAYAAAASDARMSGCELPVVINSGSGNQGITASVPVIVYARQFEKTDEELYRALLVSNLVTLHLKSGIGRLSAYCGAVSAGVGAGAGIAYLFEKNLQTVSHTIVNSIAITSGIVCDGAKPSCAAKIAMSVEAGILGYEMYKAGNQFYGGDGLVKKGVENTISNISKLGRDGMAETDKKIIEIMIS